MAFEITPLNVFPPAVGGPVPPRFIQFQIDGMDIGGLDVATLNFTGEVDTSLSTDRGKITIEATAADVPVPVSSGALTLTGLAPTVERTLGPTFFFAEMLGWSDTGPPPVPEGTPLSKRAEMLAACTAQGVLDFEAAPFTGAMATTALGPYNFSSPQASVTATFTVSGAGSQGTFDPDPDLGQLGRFNTTTGGVRMLTFADNVLITLSTPKSAFGFYGTDFGDFDGQIKALLTDDIGGTLTVDIPHTIGALADGALIFWGFINSRPIASVKLFNVLVSGPADVCGIDDIIVGDL